jgi:hypothetical protein
MLVCEPPSPATFNSNAGEPETVPAVVIEDASFGMEILRLLVIGGVRTEEVRGFFASCVMLITTLPLSSLVTVAVGRPAVYVAVFPVQLFWV